MTSRFTSRQILSIFTDTFSQEPSFRYMFPTRTVAKTRWIGILKFRSLRSRYTMQVDEADDGSVRGFACWFAPDTSPPPLWAEIYAGHILSPLVVGPRCFARMVSFANQEQRILDAYRDHWILDVVATAPEHQRKGVAKRLLGPVFARADRTSTPCFVLTHNPRNVEVYERLGFSLIVEESGKGTTAYGLRRLPNLRD